MSHDHPLDGALSRIRASGPAGYPGLDDLPVPADPAAPQPRTTPPVLGDVPPGLRTTPPILGGTPARPRTTPPVLGDIPPGLRTTPPVLGDAAPRTTPSARPVTPDRPGSSPSSSATGAPAAPAARPRTDPPTLPPAASAPAPTRSAAPTANRAATGSIPTPTGTSSTAASAPAKPKSAAEDSLLFALLRAAHASRASDLHLTVGLPPMARVDGKLAPLPLDGPIGRVLGTLREGDIAKLVSPIFTREEWERFETEHERDLAIEVEGVSRFRVNVFQQRGETGAVFRTIPSKVPRLEEIGAPGILGEFAAYPRGLVIVTGPTGSGKSTTLAAVLDEANRSRHAHIMTVEDPIEFVHQHKRCVVNQREVGVDTGSFARALRQALRQDPDIILVGEMRDWETTQVAISAAETGHLVFATLHTQSASETVNRLIDIFPADQQDQIRTQLAASLRAVVSQTLLPRADGTGRQLVAEVMVVNGAVRNLIREGKTHQLPSTIQSSSDAGMVSFDQQLAELVGRRAISYHHAVEAAHDPDEFKRLAGRGSV